MGDTDLMWDHSAGEHLIGTDPDEYQQLDDSSVLESQLLHDNEDEEAGLCDCCEHVRLSGNQLRYVLRSLDDAAALLREQRRSLVQRSLARRRQAEANADANTSSCAVGTSLRAYNGGDTTAADVRLGDQEPTSSTLLGRLSYRCCGCGRFKPTGIQRHAAAISFALQAVMLVSISIMEAVSPDSLRHSVTEMVVAMVVASISLLISLCASGFTVNQLIWNGCPIRLVVSSYVSCVISFGGFYAALYQIKDDSWRMQAPSQPPYLFFDVYCRMLYLSVSTSCLSDASAVVPLLWYSYLLHCVQMLLTVLYWGVAGYHLILATRKSRYRNGLRTTDAGSSRLCSGHRSLAASETSLISRERNFSGYGTMQNS